MAVLFRLSFSVLFFASCFGMELKDALKMAQCRAHCLDKFQTDQLSQNDATCHQNKDCFVCWDNCEFLATNFPIWSMTCNQRDICQSGCQSACEFHSQHPGMTVPLSQYNSRLTLVFSGWTAQWSLTWGRGAPREHVVFALFTRVSGKSWQLRLQTADFGTSLEDLPAGVDVKLVAVAETGVLSVIITPYAPPAHRKGSVKTAPVADQPRASYAMESNHIDADLGPMWPLLHETEVEESGLVAARVWWESQSPRGGDYLVTWEVEGGGLKGHLYTDLPEVELTLWPETVYHIQVELVSGPFGEPLRSVQITLDTHNITMAAMAQSKQNLVTPTLPLVHRYTTPVQMEILLGVCAGIIAAILVVVIVVWRRRRDSSQVYDASPSPASKWGAFNRTLSDVTLDEGLVKPIHLKFPPPPHPLSPLSLNTHFPPHMFALPPPPGAHSSHLLTFARPHHQVNLYSVVPPSSDPRQVSII